ncbi:MAG: YtxH domain-containing protein [Acidobacteriota bacterium]
MQNTNTEFDRGMSGASCFMLGLAIGSGAALLLAPMRGRHLRTLIGKRVDEGRETVNTTVKQGMDKATGAARDAKALVDMGKQRLMQERERIEAAVKAGKDAYGSVEGAAERASA